MNKIILNPRWPADDLKILTESAKNVLLQLSLNDHLVLSTSGSSAKSFLQTKLIYLSKAALQFSAEAINSAFQLTQNDIWGQVLPAFHVGGLGVEIRAGLTKSPIISLIENEKWQAQIFLNLLKKHQVTVTSLVPTQLYDLLQLHQPPPESLRFIFIGGGFLSENLFLEAQRQKWPLVMTYGMTETSSMIACSEMLNSKTTYEDFIKFKTLPHAKTKESADKFLQVQATSLMSAISFLDQDLELHIETFAAGSFYETSDRIEFSNDGSFKILGRDSDFIKISGESVGLTNLRNKLSLAITQLSNELKMSDQDFALTAVNDPRLGHRIVVYTIHELRTFDQLISKYNSAVRPFERVSEWIHVAKIPRSELGKVLWTQFSHYP